MLASIGELSVATQVRAEIARNLARHLDAVDPGGSGAVIQGVPALARELQSTLEAILRDNPIGDAFLDYLNNSEDDESKEDFIARKAAEDAKRVLT